MNFRGVTWNLNGTRKFLVNTAVLAFLSTFAVIFLQETFEVPGARPCHDLNLQGFVPRERRATRGPLGRGVGGLKTFLNGRLFGHGLITEIGTLLENVLVVRWSDDSNPGILFINVYVPRHSDDGTLLSKISH
jgi:exonuclease III